MINAMVFFVEKFDQIRIGFDLICYTLMSEGEL